MVSSDCTIDHATLKCSLRGKATTSSVQFRNLQYATVPARFQASIPNDSLKAGSNGVFDATKFGPSCPQHRGAQAWDLGLVGNVKLPCEPGQGDMAHMDEFECLHVNVTVPKDALKTSATSRRQHGLPVFVWVHGGGLGLGSNNWPQYDLQKLVDRSVEIDQPMIAVAMNYRLGLFGFAAHHELSAQGNMGFKDQVLAFRWVRKHIAGFGGDASNVTAAGESAGAISVSTLLCAQEDMGGSSTTQALFDRAIVMSGDMTLRKPRNQSWHEQMYKEQAALLATDTADSEPHGLKTKLQATDAESLAQQLPLMQHYSGHVDGTWLTRDVMPSTLADPRRIEHKPAWCKELVTGDTIHDGTILQSRILDTPDVLDRLRAACTKHLSQQEASSLFSAYKLNPNRSSSSTTTTTTTTTTTPTTPTPTPTSEQDPLKLLTLASELRFYDPVHRAHTGWTTSRPPKPCFRYHFHVPNPFDGAYQGLASHELDVAFLLLHFNALMDAPHARAATAMADHFIAYVNGGAWAARGQIVVFGAGGVREVDEGVYDAEYREGRGAVLHGMDADRLWRVAEMWQGVRSEDEDEEEEEQKQRVSGKL
ncbi:hypothetical protein ACEQ8H_000758 [Pleosporales sp. CAS-2024a]